MVSISGPVGRIAVDRATRRLRNRRARRRTTVVSAFAVSGLLALGAGSAAASPVSCGASITTDTKLHADLTNCPGDGLVIGADSLSLNLNGHTIDGDATPGTSGPDAGIRLQGHHGITIQNGTVEEFDNGVLLDAAGQNLLRHLTVLRSGARGIQLQNGSNHNRLEFDTSSDNGRSGIALLSSADNVVQHSTASGNPFNGFAGFTASHNVIRANDFSHNEAGLGVQDGSNSNRIVGNYAASNGFVGIAVEGSDQNSVTGNRSLRNGAGMILGGDGNAAVGNLVTDALICAEGCAVGIAVEGGTGNLIVANRVFRTGLEGIRVDEFEGAGGPPTIGTVMRANIVHLAGTDGIAVATSTDPNSIGGTVKDTLLERNIVIGSGHDGINVASAATTLTRNLALRNGNLGIEAVTGVIDGGGNHAFGNGNPLQCVNIAC